MNLNYLPLYLLAGTLGLCVSVAFGIWIAEKIIAYREATS